MRSGGLASENADLGGPSASRPGTDGLSRPWGLHVCGPQQRNRRLVSGPHARRTFTEHREIDDQGTSTV
jgi:hypothetical protein